MKRILLILSPTLLLGCGQGDFSDLRQFMDDAGKNATAKIEPLPPIRPHDDFVYRADQLVDPFSAGIQKDLQPETAASGLTAAASITDHALETLRVVGSLEKKGIQYAMVATPDNRLHLVKKGDRIGSNKGVVTHVDDKGIEVTERLIAGSGKWIETKTKLPKLQNPAAQ